MPVYEIESRPPSGINGDNILAPPGRARPCLPLRPLVVITLMFSMLVRPFITRPLRRLFSEDTTIRPEDTFNGKIIIVDFPVQEYRLAERATENDPAARTAADLLTPSVTRLGATCSPISWISRRSRVCPFLCPSCAR